jgi:hypothetical protein
VTILAPPTPGFAKEAAPANEGAVITTVKSAPKTITVICFFIFSLQHPT